MVLSNLGYGEAAVCRSAPAQSREFVRETVCRHLYAHRNMRSKDMRPGTAYAIHGRRRIKVTVLETPLELTIRARVRVRYETGVKQGEISEVPTRRIAEPWDGKDRLPERPKAPRPVQRPFLDRPPKLGDEVTWTEYEGLEWKVVATDRRWGTATIRTRILGQLTTRRVDAAELRVLGDAPPPPPSSEVLRYLAEISPAGGPRSDSGADEVRSDSRHRDLAPVRPRRRLDELLDDLYFPPACLDSYARRYGLRARRTALFEQLRDEIRMHGHVIDARRGAKHYATIEVPGRFHIVLPRLPTPEKPVTVNRLRFVRNKNRRAARVRVNG
jgi:hypothetical protein